MSSQDDFILMPQDVVVVRSFLLHYLPAELANIIIDEAEYWPRLTYTFNAAQEIQVSANIIGSDIAAKCCALSESLPSEEEYDVSMKIIEVRFLIEAHDQGWCSETPEEDLGPYHGSFTWFEAVIVRELQIEDVSEEEKGFLIAAALEKRHHHREPNVRDLTGQTMTLTVELGVPRVQLFGLFERTQRAVGTLITVKNTSTGSDSWTIQTNPRARSAISRHEIVWRRNDSIDDEEMHQLTGRKSGKGFIDALQPGDRVAVIARAQYPNWVNFVKMVKMEIYFAV